MHICIEDFFQVTANTEKEMTSSTPPYSFLYLLKSTANYKEVANTPLQYRSGLGTFTTPDRVEQRDFKKQQQWTSEHQRDSVSQQYTAHGTDNVANDES